MHTGSTLLLFEQLNRLYSLAGFLNVRFWPIREWATPAMIMALQVIVLSGRVKRYSGRTMPLRCAH